MINYSRASALFISGLIAGTFMYGTFTVLPAFYEVSPEIHLGFRKVLMRHNMLIVMTLVLLGIVSNIWYMWVLKRFKLKTAMVFCFIALVFTIASLVITRIGSVPINLQIKTWNPLELPPQL